MLKSSLAATAAAVLVSAFVAGSAAAAQFELRFDNPLPGGGSNPLPSFSQGGVTATPGCQVHNPLSGTTCSVTQNAEGLGVTWSRPGFPDDTSDEIDGLFRDESLTLTFSQKVRIVRIDFENVTDLDLELPFPLPDSMSMMKARCLSTAPSWASGGFRWRSASPVRAPTAPASTTATAASNAK